MARRPNPMPLWMPVVAALCFAAAAALQDDALSRVLFGVAAVVLVITAVVQHRMRRARDARDERA